MITTTSPASNSIIINVICQHCGWLIPPIHYRWARNLLFASSTSYRALTATRAGALQPGLPRPVRPGGRFV